MKSTKILQSFTIQDELNPEIWDYKDSSITGEPKMYSDVREKLLEAIDNFINFVGVDLEVEDVIMTGSLSNYNWSEFSDVDLHVLVDMDALKNKELYKELFAAKQSLWNSLHDIGVRGFEVEVYVQSSTEPHYSSGVYSVMNNQWVVSPSKVDFDLDDKKILDKTRTWMEIIDGLERKSYLLPPDETLEILQKVKDKLKKFRSCGLKNKGEFSYENLAFKFLRRNGYLRKLSQLKNQLVDDTLSLEEQKFF
jgi:hypothetical protein